jgi:site-specific DNA recombinase
MPELRKQHKASQSELVSLEEAAADQTRYLRLVDGFADFRGRISDRANTLAVLERQKILRLLVKEILVGKGTITIRHSIPMPRSCPDDGNPHVPVTSTPKTAPNSLLRSGGNFSFLFPLRFHSENGYPQ